MRPETTSWSSTGNDDMKRFTSLATKHSICKSHLKAITEYDATLTNFGFSPEFMDETTVKCKEEEDLSNQSEADSFEMCFDYKSKHKKIPKSVDNDPQTKVNCTTGITTEKTSSEPKQPNKIRTKITFKTWQELNKDLFPVSRTKFFEDYKLFKWKKRVARQELKNARLASEKLKVEIEVLKAKAEYYRSLKSEIVTLQSMPQLPSSAAVAL